MPKKRWRADLSELSLANGAICRGHRVVIPVAYRSDVQKILHEGHFGSEEMKELTRRYIWWDTLNADIERLARECTVCTEHAEQLPRAYHPWQPSEHSLIEAGSDHHPT